jgi:hypothetical protein
MPEIQNFTAIPNLEFDIGTLKVQGKVEYAIYRKTSASRSFRARDF